MTSAKKVLFVSYDGLSDPLGQSQILPYYLGLASKGHQITLLSCEKPEAFREKQAEIRARLEKAGVFWIYTFYRKSPPVLSTFFDLQEMKNKALSAHKKAAFDLVHCRTILSTDIGFALQARGAKFIFDFRGFWADERVDGALWPQNNPIYRLLYKHFKRKERKAYHRADQLVSLTEAAKTELVSRYGIPSDKIAVVPCTADLAHFQKSDKTEREKLKADLGISETATIIGYAGSLGTRYLYREMLDCFLKIKQSHTAAVFLIISNSNTQDLEQYAAKLGISDAIYTCSTSYTEIPQYISMVQIALYFIYAGNSGKAVSPTKQAEFLGMGIPIIGNEGIGDTARILKEEKAGLFIRNFSEEEYQHVADNLDQLLAISPEHLRGIAKKYFDLSAGIETYHNVYQKL